MGRDGRNGIGKTSSPQVVIELKSGAIPTGVQQYPIDKEVKEDIHPHITRLLHQGILVPCKSPWNTPLLLVKKPGRNNYQPVQDLRDVNKRIQDMHPTVPNPYIACSAHYHLSEPGTWF